MNNKEKAVDYVKITLRYYNEGNREKGSTVQEMISYADYDVQDEVEKIFAFLMPIPNNDTVYMSEQMNPLGNGGKLTLRANIDEICRKIDEY